MSVKRMDSGGIVKGPSHEEGGVPFVVTGTGQAIEVEGREAVITARAFEDKSVYTYKGTNFEILNQINQRYGGNALWEEVESIGPNDFVICIVSTEDETVREITGTNEQVVSAINESGGCKATKRGAEVVEILNGRRNKLKDGGPIDGKREQLYRRWKQLVNMSASELERFYESEEGKEAGLSAGEAKKQGIKSGRESARWIIKMKRTPKSEWTEEMWKWAGRQVSFISRMSGSKGPLYDDKGRKTRKHISLLIWGHNPERKKAGGKAMPKNGAVVTKNGYYYDLNELSEQVDAYGQTPLNLDATIVTYNSGGQSELKVVDTVNPSEMANSLSRIFNIDKNQAKIVVYLYIQQAKRLTNLSDITTERIIVMDRGDVVFENISGSYRVGGSVSEKESTLRKPRTIYISNYGKPYFVGNIYERSIEADKKFEQYRNELEQELYERGDDSIQSEEKLHEQLDYKLLDLVMDILGGKYIHIDDSRIKVRIADHDAALSRDDKNQLSFVISGNERNRGKGSTNKYFEGRWDEPSEVVFQILSDVDNAIANLPLDENEEDEDRYKTGGDVIVGGKADGMTIEDIAAHHGVSVESIIPEFLSGIKHEMEHTGSAEAATEIALDHLYERKDYYDMLHNAEKMARGGKAAAQTIASVDLIDVYKIKFQETYGFKYDELNAEFDEWASKEKGLDSAFLRAFENVKAQQGKDLIYDDVARDFFQIWLMLPNSYQIPAEKKRIGLTIESEELLEVFPPLQPVKESLWSFKVPGDYVELLEDCAGKPDGFRDYLGKVAFDVSDPDIVVAVATDANILAVVQCDNGIVKDIKAPKHGTRLYDVKNGKGEDANFPNYKLTVDDAVNNNNAELDGFDPLEVLTAVRSSVRLNKFFDTGRAKPILFGLEFVPKEVGEDEQRRFYDPKLIDTAFTLFARLGVGYVTAKTNLSGQKALLLEGRSDLVRGIVRVLVMPVYATENTYYTITYNYAIPRKQKPDNEEPKEEQAPAPAPAPAPVHSPAPQPSSSSVPAFDTPTGEPSKLTFMQQLLVRTDAFKGFFGDWEAAYERSPDLFTGYAGVSKVVEPLTREPMVVFHGTKTDKEFYEFDVYAKKIKGRPYGYFAVNEEYSHRFREMSQTGTGDNKLLYNCFLSIKKPFHAEGFDDLKKDADGWLAAIQKVVHFDLYGSHGQNAKLRQAIDDQIGDYVRKTYDNNREDFFWLLMARDVERTFKNFLMAYGYDGVIYYENFTGIYDKNNPSEYTKAFVIFDATQVKLADGRNLTFDPFSPDIRMEEGGPVIEERAASETPAATGFESMRRKMLGEATESESSTIHQFRAGGPISQDENEKWLNNFINQSHG
jgi:hypothetical protein